MTTISITTYGCAMNQSDSERIAGILRENNFDPKFNPRASLSELRFETFGLEISTAEPSNRQQSCRIKEFRSFDFPTRKISKGNFWARKTAEQFLGVAEPKGFRHVSEAEPQPHPIRQSLIRAQPEPKALVREENQIEISDDGEILILNTCSVKTPTERKIIKKLKELEISGKKVIVSGCLPAADSSIVNKFRNFSFIGNNVADIADAVKSVSLGKRFVKLLGSKNKFCIPRIRQNPVVGIMPIAEGCLGFCSYCQTRLARGRLRSYPAGEILKQVQSAVSSGAKEVWITAQDTGAYGIDTGGNLPGLLEKICGIPHDFKVIRGQSPRSSETEFRIRVGMMNPNHVLGFLDELISVYNNEKIYKFLHIPVQSGDNKILKDMKRDYKVEDFKKIVKKFRSNLDNITISTDVIVGFPAETEKEFENTLNLIKDTKPDVLNISRFWPRPGTSAEKLKQHHGRVTKNRSRGVNNLFREIGLEQNRKWIEWRGKALVSEKTEDGFCARNFAYKPIIVKSKENLLGKFVDVRITDATFYDLRGEII